MSVVSDVNLGCDFKQMKQTYFGFLYYDTVVHLKNIFTCILKWSSTVPVTYVDHEIHYLRKCIKEFSEEK